MLDAAYGSDAGCAGDAGVLDAWWDVREMNKAWWATGLQAGTAEGSVCSLPVWCPHCLYQICLITHSRYFSTFLLITVSTKASSTYT